MAAPNLNAFLAALLKQVQKAEDALKAVILVRFIGFATGANLDSIGRLVGEDRLGRLDDDIYRKAIRLRIFINGSSGRPEDIIYIARQWTGVAVVNYYDVPQSTGAGGNYRLVIPGWTPDTGQLLAFLQTVSAGGTRIISVTNTASYSPFRMGDRMGTRLVYPV